MTDHTIFEDSHRCRASFRSLGEAVDELMDLDEDLRACERALDGQLGDRWWAVPLADDRTIIVEGDPPYTTLYGTTEVVNANAPETLRPLVDLSSFWRIWRPPTALLGPAERRWLADRGLAHDPAPPLPSRWDRGHGWRDVGPDRLADIVAAVDETRRLLEARGDDRQKGAA